MITINGKNNQHMLILKRGEEVVGSVTKFLRENGIKGGLISAVGAIEDIELGLYDFGKQEYKKRKFDDAEYELVSLSGNVSLKDDDIFAHIHASISNDKMELFGGHLFHAKVAVTVEISIIELGVMPVRVMDEDVGLPLIAKTL